ncbi:hypothetical protein AVEN_100413-1, partial [Araneus ventricosus]
MLPRSPDLTSCDFFLWCYVKDKIYVPQMPTTLQALQERITAAVTDIDGKMLLNFWTECVPGDQGCTHSTFVVCISTL